MKMLIAYDISDPRRLYRVAKVMKDYGLRRQRSVFEADLSSARFKEMRRRVEGQLEWTEDGVKFFPLCKQCAPLWLELGCGSVRQNSDPFEIV